MTKERLEELIKQGATIYCLMNKSGFIAEFDLASGNFTVASDCRIFVEQEFTGHGYGYEQEITGHVYGYDFEQLFESKEQAEWVLKTHAERTERFEPPMWEEIKDTYEFHFTCQNYTHKRTDGIIETVYTPQCFMFYVHKSEQPNYNRVMIRNYRIYAINIEVFDEPATKENYEKACEIVRRLFSEEVK